MSPFACDFIKMANQSINSVNKIICMHTIFTQCLLLDGRTSILFVKEFFMGNVEPLGHMIHIYLRYSYNSG